VRSLLAFVALLLVAVPAAGADTTPRPQDRDPVFSPSGDSIAFVRSYGAMQTVMTVRPDGIGLRTVTRADGAGYLAWSPDGTTIAYSAGRDVWTVPAAGGEPRNLTNEAASQNDEAWQPSWSPDGKLIAYDRFERCFRCTGVWVMNADGTGAREVIPDGRRPQFSPDGTKLALSLARDALVVDLNGNRLVPGTGAYTVWSPRGLYVAYDGGFIVEVTTGVTRRVSALLRQKPSWSRGGKYIAAGGPLGYVYVVRASTGARVARIPASTVFPGVPSWSPTGLLAYVHRGKTGTTCGIDVAHSDGTHIRRLTRNC
jgi:Tol biopolymer transport system component